MLAKKNRFNLSEEKNSRLFSSSERFSTNSLLFYYRTDDSWLRVSAIAPSKLFNKASQRNKKRRLIYNLINKIAKKSTETKKQDLLKEKLDLIIVYKTSNIKEKNIEKDLNLFLEKNIKKNEIL